MAGNIRSGYNQWAADYDTVENKTRDLDKTALRHMLSSFSFTHVLELGCGTGKNTEWLVQRAAVTAVDFSEGMLERARSKIKDARVTFLQADITRAWPFTASSFDLVTCNLILEHIQDLTPVFGEAARVLTDQGRFFISELHPARQYMGSKARFEKGETTVVLDCFVHHLSDFLLMARQHGFTCLSLDEWFDEGDRTGIPRTVSFLFQKMDNSGRAAR